MTKRRLDIDGLRAIAVLSVLFYHLEVPAFAGGFIGVDIFFVISGYLITRKIYQEREARTFSFAGFYIGRARRLFPALFATLILSFAGSFLLLSPSLFQRFGAEMATALFSVSNFYFWGQGGYFDTEAITKPLLHTWSLSVEEQFYLIWPAILAVLPMFPQRWLAPLSLVAIGAVSLWLNFIFADEHQTIFYLMPFRIFEFAIGALAVWLYRPSNGWIRGGLVASGLALVGWSIATYSDDMLFPSYHALAPCLGAALIILAAEQSGLGRILSNRLMAGIGLISYSLYLVHWPIITLYAAYNFEPLESAEKFWLVIAAFAAALLLYHLVEFPFHRGRVSFLFRKRATAATVCVTLALCVSVPATHAWSNGGWAWRVNAMSHEHRTDVRIWQTDKQRALSKPGRKDAYTLSSGNASKSALIIGSSHANHLRGFAAYLSNRYDIEFDFHWYPGCSPIFGATKVYHPFFRDIEGPQGQIWRNKTSECKKKNEIWRKTITREKYDYVFLSDRWAWHFEGTDYGKWPMERSDLFISEDNPTFTLEASRELFKKQLPKTIDIIRSAGSVPVLVSQVPPNGKDVYGCNQVPRFIIPEITIKSRCRGVTRNVALERLKWIDDTFRQASKSNIAFALIPSDYFCGETGRYCTLFENSTPLYENDDHLRWSGAEWLARQWEADEGFPFGDPRKEVASGGN